MTIEQERILNTLLRLPARRFTLDEREFLILLSRKLRHVILSRREGIALQDICNRLLEADPIVDPGPANRFNGVDVTPEPETEDEGGPGGARPEGGDDRDPVPDINDRVRRYRED